LSCRFDFPPQIRIPNGLLCHQVYATTEEPLKILGEPEISVCVFSTRLAIYETDQEIKVAATNVELARCGRSE